MQNQIAELKAAAHETSARFAREEERSLQLDKQLSKARADLEASSLKLTNLNSVLEAARAREADSLKRDKLSEREKERREFGRSLEAEQERKDLENKIKHLESRLREAEEGLRVEQNANAGASHYGGRSRSGTRGADPIAKALALENQVLALEAENDRLRKASSAISSSPLPNKIANRARRPRSSSVTGASSHQGASSDLHSIRAESELEGLRTQIRELQTELDAANSKVQKAEREKMKAENEAIAAERVGAKRLEEVKETLDECKTELKWKSDELEDLHRERESLEKDLAKAKGGAPGTADHAHVAELQGKVQILEEELAVKTEQAQTLSSELQSVEQRSSSLQEQLDAAEKKAADATSQQPSASLTPSVSSTSLNSLGANSDRAVRELKRLLNNVERERDVLQASVTELEDALEAANVAVAGANGSSPSVEGGSEEVEKNLRVQIEALQGDLSSLQQELSQAQAELAQAELAQAKAQLGEVQQSEKVAVNHTEEESSAQQVSALEQEIEERTAAHNAAIAENAETQERLKVLEQEVLDARAALEVATSASSGHAHDQASLEHEIESLKEAATLHEEQLLTLRATKAELEEVNANLRKEREDDSIVASEKSQQQAEHIKALVEAEGRLAEQIEQLQVDLQQKSDQLERATQQLAVHEAEAAARDDTQKGNDALHEELNQRNQQIDDLLEALRKREGVLRTGKRKLHELANALSTTMVFGADSDWSMYMGGQSVADVSLSMITADNSVEREFGENLFDEIDSIRRIFDGLEKVVELQSVESQMKLKRAESELQASKSTAEGLQITINNLHAAAEAAKSDRSAHRELQDRNRDAHALLQQILLKREAIDKIARLQQESLSSRHTVERSRAHNSTLQHHLSHTSKVHSNWSKLASEIHVQSASASASTSLQFSSTSVAPSADTQLLQDKVAELEGRVLRRTEQIGLEQTKLRNAEAELQRYSTKLQLAQQDAEELNEECEAARSRVAQLEDELAQRTASNESVEHEMQELQERFREQVDTSVIAQEELDKAHKQIKQLSADLDAARAEVDAAVTDATNDAETVACTVATHADLELHLSEVRNQAQELQSALDQANTTASELRAELEAQQQKLAGLDVLTAAKEHAEAGAKEAAEAEILARQETNRVQKALRQAELTAEEALTIHAAEVKALAQQIEDQQSLIQQHVHSLSLGADAAEQNLNALRQEHATERQQLLGKIEALETDLSSLGELQDDLAALRQQKADLASSMERAVEEAVAQAVSGEQEKAEQNARELASKDAALEAAKTLEQQLRMELEQLQSKIQELDAKYWATKDDLAALQEQEEALNEQTEELDGLRREAETLRENLQRAQAEGSQLRSELCHAQDQLSSVQSQSSVSGTAFEEL